MRPRVGVVLFLVWAVLLWAATMVGCEQRGPELTSECRPQTITLTVRIFEDENDIAREAKLAGIELERGAKILGFATRVVGTDRHTVYVPLPRGQADHGRIETWGHELMHAICGGWHP